MRWRRRPAASPAWAVCVGRRRSSKAAAHEAGDGRFMAYKFWCIVVSIYFTCLRCFKRMLQVFHVNVAKVDLDVAMLHMLHKNIASV